MPSATVFNAKRLASSTIVSHNPPLTLSAWQLVTYERSIFSSLNGNCRNRAQRRITGAEIVERKRAVERAQFVCHFLGDRKVVHDLVFGQFEDEARPGFRPRAAPRAASWRSAA